MAVDLESKDTKDLQTIVDNCVRLHKTSDPRYIAASRILEARRTGDYDLEKTIAVICDFGRQRRFLSYKHVADASGLDWANVFRQINLHLDQVCIYCHDKGWPLLTAIVVNGTKLKSGEMTPANRKGFLDAAKGAGRDIDLEQVEFVRREQQRVFDWCQLEQAAALTALRAGGRPMGERLSGKVAIVTGAASRGEGVGNGAATSMLFAREGAKVVLINRDEARGEALAEQIRAEGGEASAFAADVTLQDAAEAMAAFAVERYGRLDILHNNIGFGHTGTPETLELADWNQVFEVNLTSAFMSCKACLPRMRAGGGGAILNVSSTAGAMGLSGTDGGLAYTTAKAGLHGFTLSVAADYAVHGIRANTLVVGTVFTPLVAHLGEGGRERRRKAVPLQTEGTAWDVAHAAVFLASDEARWITGVMLPIDGGFLAIRQWPR